MKTNYELHRMMAVWTILATDTELSRFVTPADQQEFIRRTEAEGVRFLTVTLPALGKALDKSFLTGQFVLPEGWLPALDHPWPAFLSRAFAVLFREDGSGTWLVPGSGYNATYAMYDKDERGLAALCIRQLTMVYYKYELPWTPDQAVATCQAFVDAEHELWANVEGLLSGGLTHTLVQGVSVSVYLDRAEKLIARLLTNVDPDQIKPRYGTGATAIKDQTQWGRWRDPRLVEKLDKLFPYFEWFKCGTVGITALGEQAGDEPARLSCVTECPEPTARVMLVPKDSRGPRLISAEPPEFMFIQQGLMKALMDAVERYPNVSTQVSIIDQSRNQQLALLASQTNHLVTLDLKEASDRLSWWLVTRLFPSNWVEAFHACRSESTIMPNGDEILLTKFAPMGSACCFPVESLVFWALANAATGDYDERFLHKRLFNRQAKRHKSKCMPMINNHLNTLSVFGDDIIVRAEDAARTVGLLEAVGLKVNVDKSFTDGPFRESCGGDYLSGINVTPLRVKRNVGGCNINVVYDFCVMLNGIYQKYGAGNPDLMIQLRELNFSCFGLRPPVEPNVREEAYQGYILTDMYHGRRMEGQCPTSNKSGFKGRHSRIVEGLNWHPRLARRKRGDKNPAKPDYGQLRIHTLVTRPDRAERDMGWSSVLRWFCLQANEVSSNIYSIRHRVHHKQAWVEVGRV